jgi:hypothetical protein
MKLTQVSEYLKSIENGPISQPDGNTCQSTCIYAVLGGEHTIQSIRSNLDTIGVAGDPAVMSTYLKANLGDRYDFCQNASITEMRSWIESGEVLISHGWLTHAGHVIVLDGVTQYGFRVMDPWEEFSGSHWAYLSEITAFQGIYSDRLIYAAFVEGDSFDHACSVYHDSVIDRSNKKAWVHRIKVK